MHFKEGKLKFCIKAVYMKRMNFIYYRMKEKAFKVQWKSKASAWKSFERSVKYSFSDLKEKWKHLWQILALLKWVENS